MPGISRVLDLIDVVSDCSGMFEGEIIMGNLGSLPTSWYLTRSVEGHHESIGTTTDFAGLVLIPENSPHTCGW